MQPNKEELNRLKELAEKEAKHEIERVNIISDSKTKKGKQYSIRIPIKFVEAVELDIEKDMFEFVLEIPPLEKGELSLTGKLVKNAK